jgi:hypothetical protein
MYKMRVCIAVSITVFLLLTTFAQAAAVDLRKGLVLYLPFDEGKGTAVNDQSDSKNNGSVKKAEWVDGKYGKALKFSADDTFVEVPFTKDFEITEGITLGAWATSNSVGYRGIINARKSTYGTFLLQQGNTGMGELGLFIGGAWLCSQTKGVLEKGAFHHIVATYDQKDGEHIYYDGKIDEALNQAPKGVGLIDVSSEDAIGIGHNYGMAGRYYDGILDEVVIYNRALSEAEVAALFKAPIPGAAVELSGKLATAWGDIKQ